MYDLQISPCMYSSIVCIWLIVHGLFLNKYVWYTGLYNYNWLVISNFFSDWNKLILVVVVVPHRSMYLNVWTIRERPLGGASLLEQLWTCWGKSVIVEVDFEDSYAQAMPVCIGLSSLCVACWSTGRTLSCFTSSTSAWSLPLSPTRRTSEIKIIEWTSENINQPQVNVFLYKSSHGHDISSQL